MLISEKIKIIESFLGNAKKTGSKKGQYLFYCPLCEIKHYKPKLAINFISDVYKCWICGCTGSLQYLIKQLGSKQNFDEWLVLTKKQDFSEFHLLQDIFERKEKNNFAKKNLEVPEEFISLVSDNKSITNKKIRNYLINNRGLTEKDIMIYKIGYAYEGDLKNRIIFLSFDEFGELNYYTSRSVADDEYNKYINCEVNKDEIIFNEMFVDFNVPITLVEGVFDSIKAGFQSIPLLGSTLSQKSKLFQKIVNYKCDVYLALDEDANMKEEKIAKSLKQYGINVFKILVNDYKDVGEMSKEVFNQRKNESFFLTSEQDMMYKLGRI